LTTTRLVARWHQDRLPESDRDGGPQIYKMNADGTGLTRLTNNAALDTEPAWSPDGTKIAFASTRDDPDPQRCGFPVLQRRGLT